MGIIRNVLAYVRHSVGARDSKDSLPPMIQGLFTHNGEDAHEAVNKISVLRRKYLFDKRTIEVEDRGAGPGSLPTDKRRVSNITRNTWHSKKHRLLHYRLIKHTEASVIVELGTSFGFTASLFAMAAPKAKVYTIEGCRNTAIMATTTFERLNLKNVILKIGEFDQELDRLLKVITHIDYVFIDGNHRMVPTFNYFLKLLPYTGQKSIFVFDDIHWSEEMNDAWKEILKHPQVTLSIELYNTGILFFDQQFSKRSVKLRY